MKKFFASAAVVAALVAGPALAFDDSDRAAVQTVFETLVNGIKANNYDDVFAVMPPAMLAKMAEPTGMDADAFKALAVEQMKAAMQQVQIKDITYDLDGMTTATSDTDRDYAIVTTKTVMDMGGTAIQAVAPALAFEDDGKWYVLQIQSPDQAAVLAEVYPDLAEVELPEPEIEPVE